MEKKEKIVLLKQYKFYLLSLSEYQNQVQGEKENSKVLVLKKKWHGEDRKVA